MAVCVLTVCISSAHCVAGSIWDKIGELQLIELTCMPHAWVLLSVSATVDCVCLSATLQLCSGTQRCRALCSVTCCAVWCRGTEARSLPLW